MSLDAIKQVSELEQSLQRQKDAAMAAAKKALLAAQAAGAEHLERSRAGAEAEVRAYRKEAEEKAAIEASGIQAAAQARCQALCEGARERLEEAVSLIVERVVSV